MNPTAPSPSVLFVDDDLQMQKLVELILRRAGYEVTTVSGGAEALARILDARPEVILADIMMPDMDGLTLLRRLRADPETRDIPVILLSAKSATADKVQGLEQGADDYLTKPFEPAELVARVQSKVRRPPMPADQLPQDRQTGLVSFTQFRRDLRRELSRSADRGGPGAVGFMEFSEMTRIRRGYGQRKQGEIIQAVGRILAELARPADVCGYDGNGRFLFLLPETTPETADLFLGAIACAVATHAFEKVSGGVHLTPTIGYAMFPPGTSAEILFDQAAAALRQAGLQRDLIPRRFSPEDRVVAREGSIRGRIRRMGLSAPFQLAVVVLLAWIAPYFIYVGLDAAGYDISYYVYLLVVCALLITAFFIWVEGILAFPRRTPPLEPAAPYPPATAIIAAYLPNEAATILETVRAFQRVEYPAPFQIILTYNTPRDLPVEEDLRMLAREDPRFELLRVPDSHSKPQNLNAALEIVRGEFTGIFDADHLPAPDSFTRAWGEISRGADVVQGHCVVRNGDSSWVAQLVAVEFEAIYAVSHPGRARLHQFAIFGGSNGYWRTGVLRETRLLSHMLTEDIDASIRLTEAGRKIICDPDILSRELAPVRLRGLWGQRLRWAQGWYQVSLRHLGAALVSPNISLRQKFGIFWLLGWREVYPWIVDQMFPLIAFWAVKFGGLDRLDWLIPVFVMTTLFTLSVGPGQTLLAYWAAAPEIRRHKAWFVRYLILSSLFYTEFKNIVARIAQINEIMKVREWVVTPRNRS